PVARHQPIPRIADETEAVQPGKQLVPMTSTVPGRGYSIRCGLPFTQTVSIPSASAKSVLRLDEATLAISTYTAPCCASRIAVSMVLSSPDAQEVRAYPDMSHTATTPVS